ncbi:MAG: LLM class flavin-dependent oxidoreductase [Deltaproteobacteria bacterium]|nr:LLM class flavin-dependent oxidoreductase [Deltaproteobacteria bacterium]MBW2444357.1 LLM class flavin-dependent oxidoreductase [Deltaproteobacteria bacterium]
MSKSLRFGLVTTDQGWLTNELGALDASSFDAVYVVDHPAFPAPDPWTWLGFAAARTERIRLGTHVTGAPFHHPTALAREVATVDRLSNGRATLGIGTGYEREDFEPFGFPMQPFADRLAMLDEVLEILRSLWTEDVTEFDGAHFRLSGGARFGPKPVQSPHPPIVVGLNRAGEALRIAVRHAQAINTWQLGPAQVRDLHFELEAACESAGRDPATLELTSDVLLARDASRSDAERLAVLVRDAARSWGRSPSVTEWGAEGVLHGDAEAVAEQAGRFQDAGVTELGVAVNHVDELHWFSEDVIPRLRGVRN